MSLPAAAVIVAAGRGERFGGGNKLLAPLAGIPILAHALTAVSAAPSVLEIVLVVAPEIRGAIANLVGGGKWPMIRTIVDGGERRQDSVAVGVAAVSRDFQLIVIHDAARPLAPASLFEACIETASISGAAIAATPITDTIKRVRDRQTVATVPRDELWAAQTPQAFRRDLLRRVMANPLATERIYTDEAAIFEALGFPVSIVLGSRANIKITHPDDLALAEALLHTMRHTV